MNYGEKCIEIYNKKFLNLKKDFISYWETNFESDESFYTLFDKYLKKLRDLQSDEYSKDPLLMKCWEEIFWFRYADFRKNAVLNIVNKTLFEKFENKLSDSESNIKNFGEFVEALSKLSIYKDFEKKIREDVDEVENAFKNKNAKRLLKIKKQKNAEYLVSYYEPKEVGNKEDVKSDAIAVNKNEEKKRTIPFNPFDDDQKYIILNAFLYCQKDKNYKISDIEAFSILKITSTALVYLPLEKIYSTKYKKVSNGIKYYDLGNREKKNQLTVLREECLKLKLVEISKYLLKEMRKY